MNDSILEKVRDGSFAFNSFELEYIFQNTDLFSKITDIVNSNEQLIGKYYDFIHSYEEEETVEECFTILTKSPLFYKICIYILNYKKQFIAENVFSFFSDKQKEDYLIEARRALDTFAFGNEEDFIPTYILKILLEEKRYDELKKFGHINYSEESIEELKDLINEYINSVDFIADAFDDIIRLLDIPLKKYPTKTLINRVNGFFHRENEEEMKRIIANRIISSSFYDYDVKNLEVFASIGYDINNPSVKLELYNMLLDKHNISGYIELITEEEFYLLKDKIIETIREEKSYIHINMSSFNIPVFFETDKDITRALASKNIGMELLNEEFVTFLEENFDEYIDSIIELLQKSVDNTSEKYHSNFHLTNGLTYLSKCEKFNNYIYNYLLNKDVPILLPDEYLIYSKVLERIVKENNMVAFEKVFRWNHFNQLLRIPNIEPMLIEFLKKDLLFANEYFDAIIISEYPKLVEFYLSLGPQYVRKIIEKYNHMEEFYVTYTKELFDLSKEMLCEETKITRVDHLEYLGETFGYDIIRYINSRSIIDLIELNDDLFYKITELFKGKYTQSEAVSFYDSLKQLEFASNNPDIINVFSNIMHAISDKKDCSTILYYISLIIDENFYSKYPDYIEAKGQEYQYLWNIVNKLNDTSLEKLERERLEKTLHIFANYYVAKKREEYRGIYNFEEECNVPVEYNQKDIRDYYIKNKFIAKNRALLITLLVDRCGISILEAHDVIDLYTEGRISEDDLIFDQRPDLEEYKNNLRKYFKDLIKISNEEFDKQDIVIDEHMISYMNPSIRKKYNYGGTRSINQILSELEIEILTKKLLTEDKKEEYDLLLSLMRKYKLHQLPQYFNELMRSLEISASPENIAGFINYFYKIVEIERKNLEKYGIDPSKLTFSSISLLRNGEAISAFSSVYSQILTPEDTRLIKSNPRPNAASEMKSSKRIEESVKQTLANFRRTKTHIPSFNEVVSFKSGDKIKKIRVVVGNFTNPSNLTHGERTGACMRLGGAGETLYDFCLNNEYGFHIRFEDPETGEYISRVSGFRNGNTVFLNELRESCNMLNYSNVDVVNACRVACDLLIVRSKESKLPIESVYIHKEYAMRSVSDTKYYSFNGVNIKKGLPNFYSDIYYGGELLASSCEPPKKIELSTDLPEYKPARDVPYVGSDIEKLTSMIDRVHAVKCVLEGEMFTEIESVLDNIEVTFGVVSDDYYVFVDSNGEIHEELIECDERALAEFKSAKKIVQEHLENDKLPELPNEGIKEEDTVIVLPVPKPIMIEERGRLL